MIVVNVIISKLRKVTFNFMVWCQREQQLPEPTKILVKLNADLLPPNKVI